jgi:hypothetical protein
MRSPDTGIGSPPAAPIVKGDSNVYFDKCLSLRCLRYTLMVQARLTVNSASATVLDLAASVSSACNGVTEGTDDLFRASLIPTCKKLEERNHEAKSTGIAFAASSSGGLATVLTLWLLSVLGIASALSRKMMRPLTPPLIYAMVVWSGLFGFLILLPVMRVSVWLRGLIFGLVPTVVLSLIMLPIKMHTGMRGLGLGAHTPAFVLVFNTVWGVVTAHLFVRAGDD